MNLRLAILLTSIASLHFFGVANADSAHSIAGDLGKDEDYGSKWDEQQEPQGYVAKNIDEWIKDFERVEIILFNYKQDEDRRLVESGRLHKGVIKEFTKRLSDEQVGQLTKAITGKHPLQGGGFCGFRPHHGFIFYGKGDEILGHLEICFLCSDYLSMPRKGLSWGWDIKELGTLVTSLGLPILKNDQEWDAFFAKRMQ